MDFQLRLPPNPSLRVEHLESSGGLPDIFGPMLFVADGPSTAQLPPAGTNDPARVFFYELDVEWPDPVEAGPRASQFDAPYPLNSPSLRSAFHEAKENAPGSAVAVSIRPHDPDVRLGNGAGGCADAEDGPSFGSPLGLRVSLGEPGEGLHSG